MAKDKAAKGGWADLAVPGARLALRVTPGGRVNAVAREGDVLRVTVTAPPADGAANDAVTVLLAHALGVARSRLTLIQGATSRDKVFRLDP